VTALRWGLLGTAHVNRRLIPAMRAARRSTIAAVASRDPVRGAAYARQWQIEVLHTGYESLLRDPHVDAVYIPLPNALHVEWTLRALDAGKHVLCEKPLALTAEDVDRIAAVSRDRQRVVAEAFMYRHEPLAARLREIVRGGALGSLRTIATGFTYAQHRAADVRLDPALGGGSLWDIGCYAVGIARLIAGSEPTAAFGWAAIGPTGVDDAFSGLLRFQDEVVASVHCGFRAAYRTWLDVAGSEAVLHVASPFKPSPREVIAVRRGDATEEIVVEGSPLLFVRQVEDFVGAALDGRTPEVTLAESRGNAAALAALHRSAASGVPVQL
jgi:predicted dehydrogenase